MKKLFCIASALALTLCFTGCNKNNGEVTDNNGSKASGGVISGIQSSVESAGSAVGSVVSGIMDGGSDTDVMTDTDTVTE